MSNIALFSRASDAACLASMIPKLLGIASCSGFLSPKARCHGDFLLFLQPFIIYGRAVLLKDSTEEMMAYSTYFQKAVQLSIGILWPLRK